MKKVVANPLDAPRARREHPDAEVVEEPYVEPGDWFLIADPSLIEVHTTMTPTHDPYSYEEETMQFLFRQSYAMTVSGHWENVTKPSAPRSRMFAKAAEEEIRHLHPDPVSRTFWRKLGRVVKYTFLAEVQEASDATFEEEVWVPGPHTVVRGLMV